MEAALRQSKAVCPFLKKTSPATLRALSTEAAPRNQVARLGGGVMSNLQVLGRRCPIMGQALMLQSAKGGRLPKMSGVAAIRAFSGKVIAGKAKLHTSAPKEARAMEGILVNQDGMSWSLNHCMASLPY